MAIFWDKSRGVYRDSRGREIPYEAVRGAIEAVAEDTRQRLQRLTERHIAGAIDFPTWATEGEELIRKSIISSGQIAGGGRQAMTPRLNGLMGGRVRFHLDKWREFGLARENGQVSDAQMVARSGMYSGAGINLYETMRQGVMIDAGYEEAMRILGPSQHCSDCPPLAGRWVPIWDMRPIGSTECVSNCACSMAYR